METSQDNKLGQLDPHYLTLIERNLRLTPEQRFEKFLIGLDFIRELRQAGKIGQSE